MTDNDVLQDSHNNSASKRIPAFVKKIWIVITIGVACQIVGEFFLHNNDPENTSFWISVLGNAFQSIGFEFWGGVILTLVFFRDNLEDSAKLTSKIQDLKLSDANSARQIKSLSKMTNEIREFQLKTDDSVKHVEMIENLTIEIRDLKLANEQLQNTLLERYVSLESILSKQMGDQTTKHSRFQSFLGNVFPLG